MQTQRRPTDPRRFSAWRLGYLLMHLQEFGLKSLRGQRGMTALESFEFMLTTLDPASVGPFRTRSRMAALHRAINCSSRHF